MLPAVAGATALVSAIGVSAAQAAVTTGDDPRPVVISLNGESATSSGTGVAISGGVVTITAAGTYQVTGSLSDGRLVVDSKGSGIVDLVLSDAGIASSTSSPLTILSATAVNLTLAGGTSNSLSDASIYSGTGGAVLPDAALFSAVDLTIGGTGALTVRGNAQHGISGQKSLTIASGTINVRADDDGVRATDALRIIDAAITVDAGSGAGLKATSVTDASKGGVAIEGGTIAVTAAKACVKAASTITISGGTQNLSCGTNGVDAGAAVTIVGGTLVVTRCDEGIEAMVVTIKGGHITITASDDGINAEIAGGPEEQEAPGVLVTISGGTIIIDSVQDGLDSNGSLTMTGGTVVVNGPVSNRSGALSVNGTFTVTGGTLLAAGCSLVGDSASEKRVPQDAVSRGFLAVTLPERHPAGTVVHLTDDTGAELVAFASSKIFQSMVYASPRVTPGKSYRVYTGGSVTGANTGGMYQAGNISGATLVATLTAGGSAPAA
jgi:hypothetical protein